MAAVCSWCSKLSKIAQGVQTSPKSLPHSSSGPSLFMMVDRFSYRRMITSKRCSREVWGSCPSPKSSTYVELYIK